MPGGRLPILTYHSLDESGSVISISPVVFKRHVQTIRDCGMRGITLEQAVTSRRESRAWPEASVVLTFDDGYANFLEIAAAALVECGFAATVFAVSGHVGGTNDWASPPPNLGRQRLMTWDQLRQVSDGGMEVGAHTVSHADLRQLPREEIKREMIQSKERLEQELGKAVESFAYPYGRYHSESAGIAADLFSSSCTTLLRRANADDRLELLPRIDTFYVQDPELFRRAILGELDGYLAVRRWGRCIRARSLAGA